MGVEFIVGFAVLLFVLCLVGEPLARALRLPHSAMLVLLGAGVAYFVTLGLGLDTGLRASSFHDLIFFAFLPVLIFEAAFKLPLAELRENLGVVMFLAIAGMLLTTLISAVLLYWGIGHPAGFPWIAALLAGSLLAATDPVAVVAQLRTLGAPERLGVLLEGESLFNDATAIVAFGVFLTLAQMPVAELSLTAAGTGFLVTFVGGGLIGVAAGIIASWIIRYAGGEYARTSACLAAAYGSFLIAEAGFHVSGVMASLLAGLMLAREARKREPDPAALDYFWGALAYVANGCVFLLMGVTITVEMFRDRWLAMVIAVVAILVARAVTTFGGLALLNPVLAERVPLNYQTAMTWGGLRGAVTLALALSLPVELPYWWTIQSMAFGVVLFTLLVQAPVMPTLLRRLGLVGRAPA